MPLRLNLTTRAKPADVLNALRRAGEWRESQMPQELRDRGCLATEASVGEHRFLIEFVRDSNQARSPICVSGTVVASADGGTTVAVAYGRTARPSSRSGLVMLAVVVAAFTIGGRWQAATAIMLFIAIAGLLLELADRTSTEGTPEAEFLLARVREAVAQAAATA